MIETTQMNTELNLLCIDNPKIRKRILNSKQLEIKTVPCLLFISSLEKRIEKYEGRDCFNWLQNIITIQQQEVALKQQQMLPPPILEPTHHHTHPQPPTHTQPPHHHTQPPQEIPIEPEETTYKITQIGEDDDDDEIEDNSNSSGDFEIGGIERAAGGSGFDMPAGFDMPRGFDMPSFESQNIDDSMAVFGFDDEPPSRKGPVKPKEKPSLKDKKKNDLLANAMAMQKTREMEEKSINRNPIAGMR